MNNPIYYQKHHNSKIYHKDWLITNDIETTMKVWYILFDNYYAFQVIQYHSAPMVNNPLFGGKLPLSLFTAFLFIPYGSGGAELHDPQKGHKTHYCLISVVSSIGHIDWFNMDMSLKPFMF